MKGRSIDPRGAISVSALDNQPPINFEAPPTAGELASFGDDPAVVKVLNWGDFFSASSCRDLLFHVNERQLTLLEIDAFLTERRLVFLGFELESHLSEKYRTRFPEDATMTSLYLWHQFELDNPHTFGGMYQFWIQKPQ